MPLRAVLIDLDETLYQPGDALIRTVDRRITLFIVLRTGLAWESADELRRELWGEFGTTARGLNFRFDVVEREVYRFAVDSVDPRRHIRADPELRRHLLAIPVPRYIFTNATRAYAERVLGALGVGDCFEGVFDIEFSLYNPKPSPLFYRRVVAALGVPADQIALVDDNPRNFGAALALGMVCVHVGAGEEPPGVIRVGGFGEVPDALGFRPERGRGSGCCKCGKPRTEVRP